MIKLSERLTIVYNMLENCDCLADVGCDHGYLSLAAVEGGRAKKVIAMDVNPGPLEKAAFNVKKAGFSDRVSTRLSDGLKAVEPFEVDAVVICGMGGKLILRILTEGFAVAKAAKFLVVEPQSDMQEFRRGVNALGFEIVDEELVTEQNKFYPVIKLVYKGEECSSLSFEEEIYGPVILKKKPELLSILVKKDRAMYQSLLNSLEKQKAKAPSESVEERLSEVCHMLDVINKLEKFIH